MNKKEIEKHKIKQGKFEQELNIKTLKDQIAGLKYNNKKAMEYISELQTKLNIINQFNYNKAKTYKIKTRKKKTQSESVAMGVLSDTHNYKEIKPETINGLNQYNRTISEERHKNFLDGFLRWLEIHRHGTSIKHGILALLGDLLHGNIVKEENINNVMSEVIFTFGIVRFIIQEMSKQFSTLTVICCTGNHSRITEKQTISSRTENSLEYLLYHFLRKAFEDKKNIIFNIPPGYFAYQDIYDYKFRFHHGDRIRYLGGVGGLTIPANKAIFNWNKNTNVYKDVFGHYHQFLNERMFVCNGSLCGYDSYAESIKATHEPPQQVFSLINKKYGLNVVSPIYV